MIIRFPRSKPEYSVTAIDDDTAQRILAVTKELEAVYRGLLHTPDPQEYSRVRDRIFESVNALDKAVTELLSTTRERANSASH